MFLLQLMSCNGSKNNGNVKKLMLNNISSETVIVSDLISDIDIIPLESRKDCMIDLPKKLIVTKKGFIVLGIQGINGNVSVFDHSGHYCNSIGRIGHAKEEYSTSIWDISTDRNGDSIFVACFDKLLLFTIKGEYLNKIMLDKNSGVVKQVGKYSLGFVTATEYTGDSYQIHAYDNNFQLICEQIPTNDNTSKLSNFVGNKLRIENDILCYCDYCNSTFHVINMSSMNEYSRAYHFSDEEMISINTSDDDVSKFSRIEGFRIEENNIIGRILDKDQNESIIKINLETEKISKLEYDSWMPYIEDYFDGYYYSIVCPTDLYELAEQNNQNLSYIEKLIVKKFKEMQEFIDEKSNYVVIKMKRL